MYYSEPQMELLKVGTDIGLSGKNGRRGRCSASVMIGA